MHFANESINAEEDSPSSAYALCTIHGIGNVVKKDTIEVKKAAVVCSRKEQYEKPLAKLGLLIQDDELLQKFDARKDELSLHRLIEVQGLLTNYGQVTSNRTISMLLRFNY